MNEQQIKEWIEQNLVMRDEAQIITGQSATGFGQSIQNGGVKAFVEFGELRKTRLYLRSDLEEYARNKRMRPSFKEKPMFETAEGLQSAVKEGVHISEEKGIIYADWLEDNGDEFRLMQSADIANVIEYLKDHGFIVSPEE
ncbi:hypothetical protein [Paenibacillus sp. FSL R7-0333]|uniref:hypothetical protein n=1 Tax=Paenibacillus sp. FSL R7-0333 TaxID=1926587 RepID=UPI00096E26BD|nr:hypothetical protein BK146_16755 [Paenibacillus sp. FSL R7-0333]